MSWLWRLVKGFFGFWYSFVIGDDWVGAAGVAVLIAGSWLLLRFGIAAYWFGPAAIGVTAVVLVARGLRRASEEGPV